MAAHAPRHTKSLAQFSLVAVVLAGPAAAAACGLLPDGPNAAGATEAGVDAPATAQNDAIAETLEPPTSASQTIGPAGGTIEVDGIRVAFPPGALSEPWELVLIVTPGPVVTIVPDISLATPATVYADGSRWPRIGLRIAAHLSNGEWHRINDVNENSDGTWSYSTDEFSSTSAPVVTVDPDCLSSWTLYDVCPTLSEPTATRLPNLSIDDVDESCLENASSIVGDRHDGTIGADRDPSEAWTMTSEAAAALQRARSIFASTSPGYDIWVNGAWDSTGSHHHNGSLHYDGAALDLVPCKTQNDGSCTKDRSALSRLPVALYSAGFTWIWYEDANHIHASISSPSLSNCANNESPDAGQQDAMPGIDAGESADSAAEASLEPDAADANSGDAPLISDAGSDSEVGAGSVVWCSTGSDCIHQFGTACVDNLTIETTGYSCANGQCVKGASQTSDCRTFGYDTCAYWTDCASGYQVAGCWYKDDPMADNCGAGQTPAKPGYPKPGP